ncbi:MAG: hypothetical protein MUF69_08305 [Desulfobacterota bacterium]|nr:hypothetical protein [Thermodesulfobacteriota bacterium]
MGASETIKCPLCGQDFTPDFQGCSASCPLGAHCNLICCPRCHYSFPRDSRTINFFKKIWKKRKGHERQP